MKSILLTAILLIPFLNVNAQEMGKLAPPKLLKKLPDNVWSIYVMFNQAIELPGGKYDKNFGGFYVTLNPGRMH